jgi:hypothetical protein
LGSNSQPSREKRSSVSVASIGAIHAGCTRFRSLGFTSAGSPSSGFLSATVLSLID